MDALTITPLMLTITPLMQTITPPMLTITKIVGSGPGRLKPKTIKFVFVASPLRMQH
jgi:hypothetical protein